jgi:hypothetical protein
MDPSQEFEDLIARCRERCLWFVAPDRLPAERELQLYFLDCIERYGNRDDFVQARKLKQWLSQHSSARFVVS